MNPILEHCLELCGLLFQGAFGIQLEVWDDDNGNLFGIGSGDDLVDFIKFNLANIPADKDFQSASARGVTVGRLLHILYEIMWLVASKLYLKLKLQLATRVFDLSLPTFPNSNA